MKFSIWWHLVAILLLFIVAIWFAGNGLASAWVGSLPDRRDYIEIYETRANFWLSISFIIFIFDIYLVIKIINKLNKNYINNKNRYKKII